MFQFSHKFVYKTIRTTLSSITVIAIRRINNHHRTHLMKTTLKGHELRKDYANYIAKTVEPPKPITLFKTAQTSTIPQHKFNRKFEVSLKCLIKLECYEGQDNVEDPTFSWNGSIGWDTKHDGTLIDFKKNKHLKHYDVIYWISQRLFTSNIMNIGNWIFGTSDYHDHLFNILDIEYLENDGTMRYELEYQNGNEITLKQLLDVCYTKTRQKFIQSILIEIWSIHCI